MVSPSRADKQLDWYNRYSRHILLNEVGESGQQHLNEARVLVIGSGGLGSPVSIYLAAAGVGTLGIVDFDKVELTNLQRQILHSTPDLGRLKVESARETLNSINPDVKVDSYAEKVTPHTIWDLIEGYDIVVDATDNFATRFLINDVCVQAKKPLVFGAVYQFSGMVTTFTQEKDAGCYRCLFSDAPEPPASTELGLLGVIPGVIGMLQATETLKLILIRNGHKVGRNLKNRLLMYDAKESFFRTVKLEKNPQCPVCANPDFDFRKAKYENLVNTSDRKIEGEATVETA